MATNTRKLASLLGASGAGIDNDGTLQTAAIKDDAITADKIVPVTAAMVAADVATQAELDAKPIYDDVSLRQDITTLALQQAIGDNSVAYNLPNSFIDQFGSDSGIGTETDTNRQTSEGGYVATTQTRTAAVATTTAGDATRSSAISKFGGYSLDLTANNTGTVNNSWLLTADLSSITNVITTGVYTIEYWARQSSGTGNSDRHFSFGDTGDGTAPVICIGYGSSTTINFYHGGSNTDISSVNRDTTTWHHYAITRNGTTVKFWVDGVYKGTVTVSGTHNLMNGNHLYIGKRHNNSLETHIGYIDEFRVSNSERYTGAGNFTEPTDSFSSDSNTVLLYHFDTTPFAESGTTISAVNGTGTMIQAANVISGSKTKVSGVMLYKNLSGTATLGTDLRIYFTCNGNAGSPDWEEVLLADMTTVTPEFSTGIKMVKLAEKTCSTAGTDIRYKAVWANQVLSSKVTELHGIGLNY